MFLSIVHVHTVTHVHKYNRKYTIKKDKTEHRTTVHKLILNVFLSSVQFGFVYIFNLIIGVGALSLPKAFSQAGIILGTLLLFMLAFMSYMTATFMIEAMAIANALFKFRQRSGQSTSSSKLSSISHTSPDIQKVDEVSAPKSQLIKVMLSFVYWTWWEISFNYLQWTHTWPLYINTTYPPPPRHTHTVWRGVW